MTLKTITDLDLELASAFYPVLVEKAGDVKKLSYNDLKRAAESKFPTLADEINRCTDQAVGRRLEVIRLFTEDKGYPDLSCLVVNRQTGECGIGFDGDPDEERSKVAAHDWSTVEEFTARVKSIAQSMARKYAPRLSEAEAIAIMSDHARLVGHHKIVPMAQRNQIIELIRSNVGAAEAFARVLS